MAVIRPKCIGATYTFSNLDTLCQPEPTIYVNVCTLKIERLRSLEPLQNPNQKNRGD